MTPAPHHTFGDIDIYLFDQLQKGRFNATRTVVDLGCGGGRNLVYFLRQGYDVRTGISIRAEADAPGLQQSEIWDEHGQIATVTFARSAKLWRINRGWRRRQTDGHLGFLIDPQNGRWIRDAAADDGAAARFDPGEDLGFGVCDRIQ